MSCCCFFSLLYWAAVISGILYFFRKYIQGPFYKKETRIDGKVVVITGCNTGIGKETAVELAKRGGKIYMACRDKDRCEAARQEIIERSGNKNIFNRTLDLGSLASVRAFAKEMLEEEPVIDILINNAGLVGPSDRRVETTDGFELHMGVNYLGPFLLTNLLLEAVKKSPKGRIVNVSAFAYIIGKIVKDDLQSKQNYNVYRAYATSKIAGILMTRELARILKGTNVTVNCCHPGVIKTELTRSVIDEGSVWKTLEEWSGFFLKTPAAGAQPTIRLALDPALDGSSGGYYFDAYWSPVFRQARDDDLAKWMWKKSLELVDLK